MAGAAPPYLYDAPSSRRLAGYPHPEFNPRAATQAHYAALSDRVEHQRAELMRTDKALINFTQNDTYMIVGTDGDDYEPMPQNTRTLVAVARWIQFALRVLQEVGALGLLVCFICLKMALDTQGWVLRIAPAWDGVVSLYAIYHLLRPARGRTPMSSSSYHFFSLIMDTGIIPFYIFIVLLANQNMNEDANANSGGGWTSVFNNPQTAVLLTYVTFLDSIALSGLHFISIALDLYLVIMFRRIAQLPPDMNPLEENLTRRPVKRLKQRAADFAMSSETLTENDLSEKKPGFYSGSTAGSDTASHLSMAKEPEAKVTALCDERPHLPRNPDSRASRRDFEAGDFYPAKTSGRNSRQNVTAIQPRRPDSALSSKQGSFYENLDDEPAPPSQIDAFNSPQPSHDQFTSATMRKQRPPTSLVTERNMLLSENWQVTTPNNGPSPISNPKRRSQTTAYAPLPAHERHDSFEPAQQPLQMNPPAPAHDDESAPMSPVSQRTVRSGTRVQELSRANKERSMTIESAAPSIQASSVYSDDVQSIRSGASRPNNATPKGKYYGDLSAATRGVRGTNAFQRPLNAGPGTLDSAYPTEPASPPKGRVLSRTGVDITDAAHSYGTETGFTVARRRDVSNSAAEQGYGAGWQSR